MCYPIVAINRGVAQFGRAPRSGRGGRKFKSCHLDQKEAGHSLECPASFFVYLQDLNLRHEAPNAQHLGETVRGTVSQRVPYISVLDYAFLPVEQHFFSGVAVLIAVLGHARYKKAGQFSNCPTVFDCFFVKRS